MKVKIPNRLRDAVKALGGIKIPETEAVLAGPFFSVDVATLDKAAFDRLYKLLQLHPDARSVRVLMNSFRRSQEEPDKNEGGAFATVASALLDYVIHDAIEGWVFEIQDNPIAYLVTGAEYHPPIKKRGEEREAFVELDTVINFRGEVKRHSRSIKASEAIGLSTAEILAEMGLTKETDELHELYHEELERYKDILPRYGEQLRLRVSRSHELEDDRYRWDRKKRKKTINLMADNAGRLVQDEETKEGKFGATMRGFNDPDNPWIDASLRERVKQAGLEGKAFRRAPRQMTLDCYHLGQHLDIHLHIRDIEIYQYDETIRQKLVLKDMYNEVLDVLTHDMSLVQEDIVEGKTGGTCVLLCGPPGVGKTLTAEVYAEFRKVPLLRIHSGQLGTTATKIEEELMTFFERANKWGIPILIDECDVFVRARANDLDQNAVVAVFLRVLEYVANTIFMTTNRAEDIDDAILSRASAIVKYELPAEDELTAIWKTQRDQILPKMTDETVNQLMYYFKAVGKKMSGRDVKNVLRLAARYEIAGRTVDTELIKLCAGFRGI